ncbi:hypothetical protein [Flavobacterium psychrophilum]|jgi:hypothetical protein|uniref:hypothetical protein n=1 Tax=Flavobacterium psychrophilum TaxID=96345 RepID=UPI000B7C4C2C|nr:hypothetical protein [Flavobacterium psychrophilum]MCB5984720.1 hypothetical protein [Flavobacterium psychrophilum]MCB5995567.1 hypothetical protein [Flavobacterium psychrophilum]MCB5997960.1 hypothetical protein [Flavobacterium psychrophilum]MCB6005466.1 hypothetical protein [Flavobacterium psychrophilum]MCB6007892.1 hypothetical protein [Flavobacterium psychrophilum]
MELDTFITKTINSIVKGVAESRDFATENGASVNPKMMSRFDGSGRTTITNLEFDVAITSSIEKETGINGGISVFNVSVGGKASDKGLEHSLSRVKFSVSIVLPETQP